MDNNVSSMAAVLLLQTFCTHMNLYIQELKNILSLIERLDTDISDDPQKNECAGMYKKEMIKDCEDTIAIRQKLAEMMISRSIDKIDPDGYGKLYNEIRTNEELNSRLLTSVISGLKIKCENIIGLSDKPLPAFEIMQKKLDESSRFVLILNDFSSEEPKKPAENISEQIYRFRRAFFTRNKAKGVFVLLKGSYVATEMTGEKNSEGKHAITPHATDVQEYLKSNGYLDKNSRVITDAVIKEKSLTAFRNAIAGFHTSQKEEHVSAEDYEEFLKDNGDL